MREADQQRLREIASSSVVWLLDSLISPAVDVRYPDGVDQAGKKL
jgi:hypothetical protein